VEDDDVEHQMGRNLLNWKKRGALGRLHNVCSWIPWSPQRRDQFEEQVQQFISNNLCLHLKHPDVPDGSDGSEGTSYPITESHTFPVAQVTGHVEYLPPLLCARYTHHQNDTCVTLFAGAAVILCRFTQCLGMFWPFFGREPYCTSPLLLYIGCLTRPIYV
jgi:hypothetical protein